MCDLGGVVTYFATQAVREFQNAIIALGLVMTAFAVLVTTFGRKVLIVVFWPEMNVVTLSTQNPRSLRDQSFRGDDRNITNLSMKNLESNSRGNNVAEQGTVFL